ncbi:MAG: response regulator [Candidatus Sumerlaeota bacterium]|nr:response regulator [Candidatus Sumerlaeota bacterium]
MPSPLFTQAKPPNKATAADTTGLIQMMVVDDDITILSLIEDVLSNDAELRLELHHDSQRALERIRTTEFDVMITDLKMPKVDGLALLHELRRLDRPTLVVIITGYATMESCLEAMHNGANDYLTKPFRLDELIHTVHSLKEQVRMKRYVRKIEQQVETLKGQMNTERRQNDSVRQRAEQLEEQNTLLQNLLRRAGINPPGAAQVVKPLTATYPRLAEKPTERITRELERLAQLEESGVITSDEAQRARRKIQETEF